MHVGLLFRHGRSISFGITATSFFSGQLPQLCPIGHAPGTIIPSPPIGGRNGKTQHQASRRARYRRHLHSVRLPDLLDYGRGCSPFRLPADDVGFEETDDGDVITVHGIPSARSEKTFGLQGYLRMLKVRKEELGDGVILYLGDNRFDLAGSSWRARNRYRSALWSRARIRT